MPATAASSPLEAASCEANPFTPKRQFRAIWIATVQRLDWPTPAGIEAMKAEYISMLDYAVATRMNAVIVQVRPTADSFWPGGLEPWSRYLTGTAGLDPGWDPMAFLVEEAHSRNLEFHAWFNPYRVSMNTDRDALAPDSPARQHPDWVVAYGGKLYYDPGLPQVRQLTTDVILEAVRRYDVDGVHFDDYFYPYPVAGQEFPDDQTFADHGGDFPDTEEGRAGWRRDNTDRLIEGLDRRIHRAKPWVKFGVSPFAVWRNIATDPEGSDTTAGAQTYDDLYADTRRWVREEWLDYVAPQVYWNIGFAPADYAVLVPWWSDQVRGTDVQLCVGQATYKVGLSTQSPDWIDDPTEMSQHLFFNRDFPQVDGDIYFSAKDVRANRLGHLDIVEADHYAHPALIPVTAGVPGHRPPAPVRLRVDGNVLSWHGGGKSYAVYRFAGADVEIDQCDLADATHLVATTRDKTWTDPTAEPGTAYTYVVTALDRAYRESAPSQRGSARAASPRAVPMVHDVR